MDGTKQYCYDNYRFRFHHPWERKAIYDDFDDIKRVDDEDCVTVRKKLASQTGFTGLSILHCLFHLYKFDILNDLVYDTMHTLILRIVYRHLHYYSDEGFFKSQDLDECLAAMPWTAGLHLCTTIIICKKYT